jgi:hypothetical protein
MKHDCFYYMLTMWSEFEKNFMLRSRQLNKDMKKHDSYDHRTA